jgi:hypothetical protein
LLVYRPPYGKLTLVQGWWVVIGDAASDTLLAIKARSPRAPPLQPLIRPQRFSFGRSHKVSLSFAPTEAGQKT